MGLATGLKLDLSLAAQPLKQMSENTRVDLQVSYLEKTSTPTHTYSHNFIKTS